MMILIKGRYEVRKYEFFFAEHFDETDEFEEDLEKMAPRSLKNIAAIQRRDVFGYMLEELGDKFSVEKMQIYEDGSVVELSRAKPHVKEITPARRKEKTKATTEDIGRILKVKVI
jgi:hypothetical protein